MVASYSARVSLWKISGSEVWHRFMRRPLAGDTLVMSVCHCMHIQHYTTIDIVYLWWSMSICLGNPLYVLWRGPGKHNIYIITSILLLLMLESRGLPDCASGPFRFFNSQAWGDVVSDWAHGHGHRPIHELSHKSLQQQTLGLRCVVRPLRRTASGSAFRTSSYFLFISFHIFCYPFSVFLLLSYSQSLWWILVRLISAWAVDIVTSWSWSCGGRDSSHHFPSNTICCSHSLPTAAGKLRRTDRTSEKVPGIHRAYHFGLY